MNILLCLNTQAKMEDSVNVLKFAESRAQEIMTLMEEVVSKRPKQILQKLPYHMRRRAASHNPKRLPRSLRLKNTEEVLSTKQKKKRKCHKNLLEKYNSRQVGRDSWLPTHIWFSKRFHMKKMWGYHLPIQATGKRFRSSYRASTKNALVQDLSYFCCIELQGNKDNILSHLSVLTDDSLGMNFASESSIDGTKEGNCFLYHPHSFPFNAIGPVSFLWNPLHTILKETDTVASDLDLNSQLWIWCHPTINEELVDILINIFHLKEVKNMEDMHKQYVFASKVNYMKTKLNFQQEPVFANSDITMIILKNTLIRHRIIGPNASSVLTSILNLGDDDNTCDDEIDDTLKLLAGAQHETICNFKDSCNNSTTDKSDLVKKKIWSYLKETISTYSIPMKTVIGLTVDDPRLYVTPKYSQYTKNDDSQSMQKIHTPVLPEFSNPYTAISTLWNQEVRNKVTASQIPEHVINHERAKYVVPSATDLRKHTSKVPLILIHQPGVNGYGSGWDIIAPQGWGMPFWIPFIYHGAQPAGFDDYCSIHLEIGCPTFPNSFPDTKAGSAHEEIIKETNLKKFYKYSKSKRPNLKLLGITMPFFMQWNKLVNDWENEFINNYSNKLIESSNTEPLFVHTDLNIKNNFFTLRSIKQINHIKYLCKSLEKSHNSHNNGDILILKNSINILIQTLIKPCNVYLKCIISVRVKCLFRGIPSNLSGIYLPNESDLIKLKENPQYFGPVESQHRENNECYNILPNKQRRMFKEEIKSHSNTFDMPDVKTIISSCDRKMIGYISEGDYSRICSHGCGMGHCVLSGFSSLLELCVNYQISATVLVREQHSFQYRFASIEIIENPF